MSHIPDPIRTPDGPTYEGRPLDHPDDEVVDQGAPFDIRTLLSRRGLLGVLGIGAGAAVLAACAPLSSAPQPTASQASTPTPPSPSPAASAIPTTEIPDETAGPYPGDGSNGPDVLEQSGIVRSDIRQSLDGGTVADGIPLTLTLTVIDLAGGGTAFAGAAVYVWQCDALGQYSMYTPAIESETYLRGVQEVNADGTVTFTTIFPGCYSGRWPHIHMEIYPSVSSITDHTAAIATSQVALPQAASVAVYADSRYTGSARNLSHIGAVTNDNVFGDDGGIHQLAAITGSVSAGYAASLVVPVDIRTTPTGGGMGGGPSGPGRLGEPPRG